VASYSELDPAPVRATIERLALRIGERFPGSGLSGVAAELVRVAEHNQQVIGALRQPLWWVRAMTVFTIAMLVALLIWAGLQLLHVVEVGRITVPDLLQAVDAATNELIVLALGVAFLVSLETRLKRRTALRMLHELRSVAHVVDMHQLTKDPEFVLHPIAATDSSPVRTLSRDQLQRYLDYCTELLALTSKLAALHAQHLQDPVVLEAVNDLESLTSDLARKIWQKISILTSARDA